MSAALERNLALVAALEFNAGVQALVDPPGVYSLVPKSNPGSRYIIVGTTNESNVETFNRVGAMGSEEIHIYTPINDGKIGGLRVYKAIHAALNRKKLPMDGHRMIMGRVEYILDLIDEDGQSVHTMARYTALSMPEAPAAAASTESSGDFTVQPIFGL